MRARLLEGSAGQREFGPFVLEITRPSDTLFCCLRRNSAAFGHLFISQFLALLRLEEMDVELMAAPIRVEFPVYSGKTAFWIPKEMCRHGRLSGKPSAEIPSIALHGPGEIIIADPPKSSDQQDRKSDV